MAAAFPIPLTAAQLGTYFVGQYYQVLQQQPEIVHQFYSDASTMLRIDGHIRESATAMLQIHTLVMSCNFVGVEIKTINSLESWNGGLLVIISGSVRQKNFSGNRKFVQTFFLAPQEKGLFILNDVFHFVEEDQIQHNPAVLIAQNNVNVKLSAPTTNEDTVASYGPGGEVETRDFNHPKEKENGPIVDNYMLHEQVSEPEKFHEDAVGAESNGPTQDAVVEDRTATSVDEAAGEPQKHTYASILRVAKGQSAPSVSVHSKNVPAAAAAASEWDQLPPPPPEHSNQQRLAASPNTYERSRVEIAEEVTGVEDEGYDVKSVYVRNLPSSVSESEIEEEFSKFGRIRADGVVIRGRKDMGVCYAFVEFEDMVGVENAVKASSVQIAGRQAYIEERRPNNNNNASRGKGRGRGGRQQSEAAAARGRFRGSRTFGGGGGGEYNNRSRGGGGYNGFHRSNPPRQPSSSLGGGSNQEAPKFNT